MSKLSAQETRHCSINALKMIYYVIIGLAFAKALTIVLKDGSVILLFAFFFTICRFVHGASIHLRMDIDSEKRWKLLWDFFEFFLQASFFYLMAVSLESPKAFSLFFVFMLLGDASWLILLRLINYIDFDRTVKQWLLSDFLIIAGLFVIYIIDRTLACVWSVVLILIIAIVATFLDYFLNKDFYFPANENASSECGQGKAYAERGCSG